MVTESLLYHVSFKYYIYSSCPLLINIKSRGRGGKELPPLDLFAQLK